MLEKNAQDIPMFIEMSCEYYFTENVFYEKEVVFGYFKSLLSF